MNSLKLIHKITHFTAMFNMLTKESLIDEQTIVPNSTSLVGIKSDLSGSKLHFISLNGMLQLFV